MQVLAYPLLHELRRAYLSGQRSLGARRALGREGGDGDGGDEGGARGGSGAGSSSSGPAGATRGRAAKVNHGHGGRSCCPGSRGGEAAAEEEEVAGAAAAGVVVSPVMFGFKVPAMMAALGT